MLKNFKASKFFKVASFYILPQPEMTYEYKLFRIYKNIKFRIGKLLFGGKHHLSTKEIVDRNRGDWHIKLSDSRVKDQFAILDKYFEFIVNHISKSKKVSILDVGCREGYLLERLKKHGIEDIRGFEIVPEWVDYCHSKKRYYVEEKNLLEINPDNYKKYDIVLSRHTLEHVDRTKQFFNNLVKLTKEKGYLIVVFPLNKKLNFKHPSYLPSVKYVINNFDFDNLNILYIGRLNNFNYKGAKIDLLDKRESDEIIIFCRKKEISK